jgi:hypothetical protein
MYSDSYGSSDGSDLSLAGRSLAPISIYGKADVCAETSLSDSHIVEKKSLNFQGNYTWDPLPVMVKIAKHICAAGFRDSCRNYMSLMLIHPFVRPYRHLNRMKPI